MKRNNKRKGTGMKTDSGKKKTVAKEYSIETDNKFTADVELGPNVFKDVEFTVDIPKDGNLTYDDVENKAYDETEKVFPIKSFPNLSINRIYVLCSETGKLCPVLSESDKSGINKLKRSKEHERYLVLPDAMYSLTPEAKLWLTLKAQGVYSEDQEFDFDAMHRIIELASKSEENE